jgi:hypothetical protein
LSAFSNWNRNALSMTTFGDLNMFAGKYEQENFNNFVTSVNGRYDVAAQTWLAARAGYQHLAEPRSSPNDAGGSEPTTFDVYSSGVSGYRGVGKIHVGADYDIKRLSYFDTPAHGGNIYEGFRDRNEQLVGGKVSYDLTGNLKPYIKAGYDLRSYDNSSLRNSDGYRVAAGTTADFGGITSLDIFAGWLSQDYSNFSTNTVNSAPDFGARFVWNVTGLTTLVLETSRSVEETTDASYNSMLATGGSATLTHELLRNLLIEADASYTRDDFNGIGTRQDDVYSVGTGARWFINRRLYTDLDYSWNTRVSNQSANDYKAHIVSARLGVQF